MWNPGLDGRAEPTREEQENRAYRRAIAAFGRIRFLALARKMVHILQRYPAADIYDMGCYNSIWDEYCYEVQHGPTDQLSWAWDALLLPHLTIIVKTIPEGERLLLSLDANEILNDQWDIEDWNAVSEENIRRVVEQELRGIAIDRDLSRIVQRRKRPKRSIRKARVIVDQ